MAISKIILNGQTQMDVTQDTVNENNLLAGETATKANGVRVTGTYVPSGSIDQEIIDAMTRYKKIPVSSTAVGYLRSNGTIDTSESGGIVHKYELPNGTESVALNGTSELYVPGNMWAVYWFVADGEMIDYYSPVSEPEVFYNKIIEVPEGATEFWSNDIAPSIKSEIIEPVDPLDGMGRQWKGRLWYAYGTSITDTSSTGRYPLYLAEMSGMRLVDKGIAGGGIGDLGGYSEGQVYDAICNITDGKINADLITLETGANDDGASVPLGTVYDTGKSTLAGCLNDCLRYLQTNTNAQIVVTYSPASTTAPNATDKYYEWEEMVERICKINRVYYLRPATNMGYAKLTSSSGSLYVEDNIHQTCLGGYIMAQSLWYQLRNIPLFYNTMPTGNEDPPEGIWETVFDGTVNCSGEWESPLYYGNINNFGTTIPQNSVWKVTWDGTPYVCEATWEGQSDQTPYAIGNYTYDEGQGGTEFPFYMQIFWSTTLIVVGSSGNHSVKIEKQV